MAKLFASNLSAVVPTPSTFVKSAIKRLGYTAHTCGYWPHSLEMWIHGVCIPDWILSTSIWGNIMLKEGTKHYEHALRVLKAGTAEKWRNKKKTLFWYLFSWINYCYENVQYKHCHFRLNTIVISAFRLPNFARFIVLKWILRIIWSACCQRLFAK